jgi:impB/mucB/samB family C-terminal domain/IMS family HHH motif/impB/mucB/samB family
MIRAKILSETGLTASAGISYNKFLAKLASDQNKPNGQFVITPKMGPAFVQDLPVGKFHGIGPATSAKLNGLGIFTGLDMRNRTLEFMTANFGKAGSYYYWISRGIDERPIRANRIRKSVGAENTFSQDLADHEALAAELQPLIEKVWRHCETTGARGRTATLKVKFSDFELITRSKSVTLIDSANDLSSLALELLKQLMPPKKAIRLGLSSCLARGNCGCAPRSARSRGALRLPSYWPRTHSWSDSASHNSSFGVSPRRYNTVVSSLRCAWSLHRRLWDPCGRGNCSATVEYGGMANGHVVLVTTEPTGGGAAVRSIYFVAEGQLSLRSWPPMRAQRRWCSFPKLPSKRSD